MNRMLIAVASFLCMLMLILVLPPSGKAWGEEGHRYINRVAAEKLPADMPQFFRDAADRLSFLGPEPDRWRDSRELYGALGAVNGPDHFVDFDKPEEFSALPNDRYKYSDWLRSTGRNPEATGFLPYAILENFQKVEVLFRLWRDPHHADERAQIEQNIVFYAGVLGHYVADGSQPLHTSIHYNGWSTSANPDLFTREPLHGRFETAFVKANIKPEDFSGEVKTATELPDAFAADVKYLLDSNSHVAELYRMDKVVKWDANNHSPEAKKFVCERLAAGSQMLANLWYTAWVDSARGARGEGDR
jgi:hypothetical protein